MKMRRFAIGIGLSVLLAPAALGGYELELVASGLDKPLYATSAPGDPAGLYIVQQRDAGTGPGLHTGTIVRHDLSTGSTTPFLQVSNLDADTQGGLHAVAFHPDYQPGVAGSKLYLVALEPSPVPLISTSTLQEWVLDAGGAPAYSRTLLEFPGLETNDATHAMDWVGFHPHASGVERDYLYVSIGDGGIQANEDDYTNFPQDLTSPRGKILRIDVGGDDAYPMDDTRNFGLTPTVYFGDDDANDDIAGETAAEILYSGLRNPWRVSFDRATGDMWIADVGAGGQDEINFVEGTPIGLEISGQPAQPGDGAAVGIDFGWPRREGFRDGIWEGDKNQDPDGPAGIRPDSLDPIKAFSRFGDPDSIRSITGGYVYRGPSEHPALAGMYVFGGFDFPEPKVLLGQRNNAGQLDVQVITDELLASIAGIGRTLDQLSSFGEDAEGNLYVIDFGDECGSGCTDETGWTGVLTQFGTGEIYRLVYVSDPATGDYNSDGRVDLADYTIWRDSLGSSTQLAADGNGNDMIDSGDYTVWKQQFGSIAGTGAIAGSQVPEPAALWLLACGLALCIRRRCAATNLRSRHTLPPSRPPGRLR